MTMTRNSVLLYLNLVVVLLMAIGLFISSWESWERNARIASLEKMIETLAVEVRTLKYSALERKLQDANR